MGARVGRRMHHDEEERHNDRDGAEDGRETQSKLMKGVVVPYLIFGDSLIFQRAVTHWPTHTGD